MIGIVNGGLNQPLHAPDSPEGDWRPDDLTPVEQELLAAVKTGQLVSREGPFALESMQAWGAERMIRADVLRHLLVAEQWRCHAKGVRLRGVLVSGQLDLESATIRCPLHLDRCYFDYGGPVVLQHATASMLILTGCHIAGLEGDTLVVTRKFDLTSTTFTGPVRLPGANITARLIMRGAQLTGSDEAGDALNAYEIKVGGDVLLDSSGETGPFTAAGGVHLVGADITGALVMSGAQINRANKEGHALAADGIKVRLGVFLDSSDDRGTFTAAGAIRLRVADIAGAFYMSGARLTRAGEDDYALVANGIKVVGSVFLDSSDDTGAFTAEGAIGLSDADITGVLNMGGALLNRADKDGNALVASRIKVGGDVFFRSSSDRGTFTAAGALRLAGADITGTLFMSGARLNRADKAGNALAANGIKVGGDVFLDQFGDQKGAFCATGALLLADARVGGSLYLTGADLKGEAGKTALNAEGIQIIRKLAWRPTKPVLGQVNLEGAAAGELADDWTGPRLKQNGYWPQDLRLDGFTYTTIRADNKAGVDQRLDWIRGSSKGKVGRRGRDKGATAAGLAATTEAARAETPDPDRPAFASGPYEQLLKMYQQAGDDTAARQVAINQRRDQRKLGHLKWYRKRFNWLLDITIGYGYRTWEALILLGGLYVLVLAVTFIALNHHGAIVPVPGPAKGINPAPAALLCQNNYPCFNPFGYAFDTVVPVISVHQAQYWQPDASTPWGGVCAWVSAAGTVAGWLLVTLAVAGYTGLARRVDAP